MALGVFWQFVGWFSLPVLAILAAVVIWRGSHRQFPYFFSYVVSAEVIGVLRLTIYYWLPTWYLYTYWISDVVITLFALLATYELFLRRLFPAFHKTAFYRLLFLATAILFSFLAAPIALQTKHVHILTVILRVLDFLRVAILIFFVGLMLIMGRSWTRSEFGVALGLAVQAAGMLTTFAIWAKVPVLKGFIGQLPTVVYDLACLIWLIAFLRPPESTGAPITPANPEVIHNAREWEEALKQVVAKNKSRL